MNRVPWHFLASLASMVWAIGFAGHAQATPVKAAPHYCTQAVPFAVGGSPMIWGDRVVYLRQQRLGVFDLATGTNYFPISIASGLILNAGIAGDLVYYSSWRLNGSVPSNLNEIHLLDLVTGTDTLIEQRASSSGLVLAYLTGSTELDPANPNDFALAWQFHNFGTPDVLHWCQSTSNCLSSNYHTGFPGTLPVGTPGTRTGDSVMPYGISLSLGAFFYEVFTGTMRSFHVLMPTLAPALHIQLGAYPTMVSELKIAGPLRVLTGVTPPEVYVDAFNTLLGSSIFRSNTPPNAMDYGGRISNLSSIEGLQLVAFVRATAKSVIKATFFEGVNTQVPIDIPSTLPGWDDCSVVSVSGNRLVMQCDNQNLTNPLPILLVSQCYR